VPDGPLDHSDSPDACDRPDDDVDVDVIGDEELTTLALAADPDQPIPDDAVPFTTPDQVATGLLPEWYMPAPSLRRSTPRTIVLAGVAIALFVINVGGVCVTYGIPDPVWK
jgi:hypothetical protein